MNQRASFLTLLTIIIVMSGCSGDKMYEQGAESYSNGGIDSAIATFKRASFLGNAKAMKFLGDIYRDGADGVPRDLEEAAKWYRKGADKGYAKAQYALGYMYFRGDGVPQDKNEASKLWRLAADQGHAPSQYNVAAGHARDLDFDLAAEWYRKAAEQGDSDAQERLGFLYSGGLGVERDMKESAKWYLLSAGQGNEDAEKAISSFIEYGMALAELAEQGEPRAQMKLAEIYEKGKETYGIEELGEEIPKNLPEAVKWYRRAAELGIKEGDEKAAAIIAGGVQLREIAEQGDAEAQNRWGVVLATGNGAPQNEAEAVEWFKRAADQDNQWGQANLGAFLFQGRGIEQNEEEGLKWSRLAADKGNYVGQFWVGFAYDDGVGAPEDNKQAIHWYRLSADQGYAEAQYALGVMYANGEGAPKDVSKGKYYVELAADKGFRPAQSWLKEFQAGGPLTDAESQLPAIESGVSEAGSPADDLAPDVQESKLESDAIEFVRIMNADWSANDEKASKVAANVYADTVNFYGQNVTRNEIIKQKKAFLTRWPVRNYRERPEETRVSCNLVGKRCSITGIVDWQVESEIRNARSKGVSEFELEIDYSSGMPQVVMEDGRVSQREQTR